MIPSTQAIWYGRYRTRFRRERDQFPGIGFRISEPQRHREHRVLKAKIAEGAKLPIVRTGPAERATKRSRLSVSLCLCGSSWIRSQRDDPLRSLRPSRLFGGQFLVRRRQHAGERQHRSVGNVIGEARQRRRGNNLLLRACWAAVPAFAVVSLCSLSQRSCCTMLFTTGLNATFPAV